MIKNNIKRAGLLLLAICSLTATACNTKIKVDYGYKASDFIELGQYKDIEVVVDRTSIESELLEKRILEDVEDKTTYSEVDRQAKENDQLLITYSGFVSGISMDGLSNTSGYTMILGKDSFEKDVPEIEEALYGMVTGQTKIIKVTLPESYKDTTYAGANVVFEITVQSVSSPNVPMITDAYVKESFGYDNVEAYKTAIKNEISEDVEEKVNNEIKEKVLTKLQENSKVISIPEALNTEFTEKYTKSIGFYATYLNVSKDEYCQSYYGFSFDEYVRRACIQQLIMQAVIEKEGFEITEYEYKGNIDDFAKENGYSNSDTFVEEFGKDSVVKGMLTNKAQNLVIESAKVTYN